MYHYCIEAQEDFPKLSPFATWPGTMIKSHVLELTLSWTIFHGPKNVQAIEVWLNIQVVSKDPEKKFNQTLWPWPQNHRIGQG